MTIKLTEQEVKDKHPKQYEDIVKQITKKKRDVADTKWSYEYGVMLGGSVEDDPTTVAEAIEKAQGSYMIGLCAKVGRSTSSASLRDEKLPQAFEDLVIKQFTKTLKRNIKINTFHNNMDSVLHEVGKAGSSIDTSPKTPSVMNGHSFLAHLANRQTAVRPVFPTLEDMRSVRPEIVSEYEALADGTKLVMFNPTHGNTDKNGFLVYDILVSTRRIKTNETRLIVDRNINYEIHGDTAVFSGFLSGVDKMIEAAEGTEFYGWSRIKQYRYTKEEVSDMVKGKVFKFSSDMGAITKSMGSGFAAFSI
jgi:hypothetical protein